MEYDNIMGGNICSGVGVERFHEQGKSTKYIVSKHLCGIEGCRKAFFSSTVQDSRGLWGQGLDRAATFAATPAVFASSGGDSHPLMVVQSEEMETPVGEISD